LRISSGLRGQLVFFAYVLGVALVVCLLPARFTAPARVVFTEVVGPVEGVTFHAAGDTIATAGTLRDAFLGQERSRLTEREFESLQNRCHLLEDKLREWQRRLSSYEQLRIKGFSFRAVSAVVTAYDTSPMHRGITIAAGTRAGLREGVAVTAMGAVVGTVSEVGPWRSRVRLITDAVSVLPCRVQRTRDLCVMRGTGGVTCVVQWIERGREVRRGDVLVTSPVDDVVGERPIVPPGLPVATVVHVERPGAEPLFQRVTAAPRIEPSRLEVVEVIIPYTPSGD